MCKLIIITNLSNLLFLLVAENPVEHKRERFFIQGNKSDNSRNKPLLLGLNLYNEAQRNAFLGHELSNTRIMGISPLLVLSLLAVGCKEDYSNKSPCVLAPSF